MSYYDESWIKYIQKLSEHHGEPEEGVTRSEINLYKAGIITGGNDVLEDYVQSMESELKDSTFYTGRDIKKLLREVKPRKDFQVLLSNLKK